MKILVLDNYDSFTYNLVYLLQKVGGSSQIDVFRNDQIDLLSISNYDKIVLSPGPSLPADAGIMPQLIKQYAPSKSILGVCLGHQGIVEAFGGQLINLDTVLHGFQTKLHISDSADYLLEQVSNESNIGLYHSWTAKEEALPDTLKITAKSSEGLVMAIAHKYHDVRGVQFHPESIMTEYGEQMITNWINKN